jgi:putative transport protein
MLDILAGSPLLCLFVVVAFGTLLGMVPFGPVKFGAAGALFVGLALGALDPRLGQNLGLVQSFGLALFVYTIGLASGASFFRTVRRQLPLMLGSLAVLILATATTIAAGSALGLNSALQGGTFAGALTSTPTLAAATAKAGSDEPAVGYALAYPFGVLITILLVSFVLGRRWPAPKDPVSAAGQGLVDLSIEVVRPVRMAEVPGLQEHLVRFSYLTRNGATRVVTADEQFEPGDRVVVVGPADSVRTAIDFLGQQAGAHLANDRSAVDYRRIVVSNPSVAGRTIGELGVPDRFGGVVTRVRRGDADTLAHDEFVIELGDRLRVVAPRSQMPSVAEYLGDSERKVSEVDALSMGIGLALGLLVGLIVLPLPGGIRLSLGAAAGPLVIGMVLGRLERTGPIVWGLPTSANLTIRQLGLLMFLAAVGLSSGQAFASQAFTLLGLRIVVVGVACVLVAAILMVLIGRALGVSPARAAGALAGFIGQPAILAFADGKVDDDRIGTGYSTLFAIGMIGKILLVQVIVALGL